MGLRVPKGKPTREKLWGLHSLRLHFVKSLESLLEWCEMQEALRQQMQEAFCCCVQPQSNITYCLVVVCHVGTQQEQMALQAGFARAAHFEVAFGLMGVLVMTK